MNRSLVKDMVFLPNYYEDYAVAQPAGMPIEATAEDSEVDNLP